MSPPTSSDLPGPRRATCKRSCLVLHRVGFALPYMSPRKRCALTAPFHPYRPCSLTCGGTTLAVYFLWHFPAGFPGWVLPSTLPIWCPDFPRSITSVANWSDGSDFIRYRLRTRVNILLCSIWTYPYQQKCWLKRSEYTDNTPGQLSVIDHDRL